MVDIVERLRDAANQKFTQDGQVFQLTFCGEAADEIERLREALQSIKKIPNSEAAYGITQTFVDDALKEKE